MWIIPWPCLFWGWGEGWGMGPWGFSSFVSSLCISSLSTPLADNKPWHFFLLLSALFRQVSTVPRPAPNSIPSNFSACPFNFVYILEEFVRECRIHPLIYMQCNILSLGNKTLLCLYPVTQREPCELKKAVCVLKLEWCRDLFLKCSRGVMCKFKPK